MKKMGRPTLYKPEYCDKIIQYFDIVPYRTVQVKEKDTTKGKKNEGKTIVKFVEKPEDMRFLEDFAQEIGVKSRTLLLWVEKYPKFKEAYDRAKELQQRNLIINGLKGLYNPAAYIFTMKNIAGWRNDPLVDNSKHYNFTNILQKIRYMNENKEKKADSGAGDFTESSFLGEQS